MREERLTDFLHTRYGLLLLLLLSAAAVAAAYVHGAAAGVATGLLDDPQLALVAASGLNLLAALLLLYINKRYNILRSTSALFAGMFLVMQAAMPALSVALGGGVIMAVVVLLATAALFATFQQPWRTRQTFLAFCTVSAGALLDIACAAYIVALLMGCAQMRATSPRMLLAALLGVATPWWIAWGFGLLDLSGLRLPQWAVAAAPAAAAADHAAMLHVWLYAAATFLLGTGTGLFNLLKIYSYNARTRAYNGFVAVIAATTALLMVCDFRRMEVYLPLLNLCTAIQLGHFFVINRRKRSYIAILCIIGLYGLLYALFLYI